MDHWSSSDFARITLLPVFLCLTPLLSGCADKAAIKEQERARYEALEVKLIKDQEAMDRRRKSELRVAERLSQLDADRAAKYQAIRPTDKSASSADAFELQTRQSNAADSGPLATPIVTQLTVDEKYTQPNSPAWVVKSVPSPISGSPLCVVASNEIPVKNGDFNTRVTVYISNERVYLTTDARLDTEAPESGFRIDSSLPVAIDRFVNEVTAVVEEGYDRVVSSLSTGTSLTASFAYLPQLSSADTHRIELDLSTFATALSELPNCISSISAD